MPAITLPDGSVRRFDGPVTGTEVAEVRAALAGLIAGQDENAPGPSRP